MTTILSVAYPFAPVGPASAGGAEQVLHMVEAGLGRRGFRSVVVAQAGSTVAGELLPTPAPDGILTPRLRAEVEDAHRRGIDRALERHAVDLVHMHGIDFAHYPIPPRFPVLATLHLPPSWYPEEIWHLPPHYTLQCVSESQRQGCPAAVRDRLRVVGNGVALPPPAASDRRGRFALMLSRICPEKNLHVGLDAARLAGIPAILAGQVFPYPEHLRYFEEQIRPRLGRGARLIAPVGGERKARLLGRARCLLLPTLAPETSSLVAMEAIAAGTPVVAMPSGAIPEIVQNGRTGLLLSEAAGAAGADAAAAAEEMSRLIPLSGALSPAVCRAEAARRFDAERMVDEYARLYATLGQEAAAR